MRRWLRDGVNAAAGIRRETQALQLALPHSRPSKKQVFLGCHGAGIEAIGEAVRQRLRPVCLALPWPRRR